MESSKMSPKAFKIWPGIAVKGDNQAMQRMDMQLERQYPKAVKER